MRIVLAVLLFAACSKDSPQPGRNTSPSSVRKTDEQLGKDRVQRQTAAAIIATGPISTELPLLGTAGTDGNGYPTQYVDPGAFVGLLRAKRFDLLEKHFDTLEAAYEKDWHDEYWVDDAAASFHIADATLTPLLDEWVAHSPKSWAALLSRGTHLLSRAYAQRGGAFYKDTSASDLAAMEATLPRATADLDAAFSLRPRSIAAFTALVNVDNLIGDAERLGRARAQVSQVCDACIRHRVAIIHSLTPRWGGSYEAMTAFARSAPIAKNRALRFLAGYVDLDRSELLDGEDKLDEAMVAIDKAIALGEYPKFLYQRGAIENRAKQYEAAEKDLARAIALRPNDSSFLHQHAYALACLKQYEAAGRELSAALRIDPTDAGSRDMIDWVVKGLAWQSNQDLKAGKQADAIRVSEIATNLAPRSRDAQVAHNWALAGGKVPQAGDIDGLKAQVAASPDDLALHQRLDLAYAQQNRFADVVEMWNVFIAAHPTSARAYLERGGALFHLGKRDDAALDARKACDLGESEGCQRATMLGK